MGKRRHRAVEIRGVVYPDANVAAAVVGVQPQTVICAIRNGTLDDCGLGKVGAKPMPIRIRGVDYPNARAAAQALGVSPGAVYMGLRRGTIDNVGLGSGCGPKPIPLRPVTLGAIHFPSVRAAARALGLKSNYLSRALNGNSRVMRERVYAAAMAYAAQGRHTGGAL